PDGGGKAGPRRVAIGRLLGERNLEHSVQRRREVRSQARDRWRRIYEMRLQDEEVALANERRMPGQAMEEDAAERVDVGASVDRQALNLLGRGIVDRPEEGARLRDAMRARLLREPEVAEVQ